ncbi:lipid A biosynthesis acyltransferase [Guyparkeria halophila]|uniref:Lipid A biosynthesis acyltransferase n=1 Tax=Guyparkeria halophila TaxID=47960 RepID=A0A6I6D2T2_9GAMM|nr:MULTISPECIES: lysophospholipid acyltransferase family protein [Guyparkeria]QGT77641.1 lipid A biosynthesis acyltransferase [Guyparkeria halophila]
MSKRRDSAWYRWRGRLRLGAARAVLVGLGWLSLGAAQRLGSGLGRLAWMSNGSMRRTVEDNLARCLPETDEGEREAIARRTLIETGKGLIETAPVWRWGPADIEAAIVERRGFDAIEQALAAGRGVILLAPHMGNWELGGLATAARTPTTIMYRPPREPAMERLLVDARARTGASLAPANLGGVRKALRALKRGELVAILPDQAPRHGEGVTAPFFGQPALTMTLIRTLSRRTDAAVFTGWAERLPGARGFRIHYEPVTEPVGHDDPVEAAMALNREIERVVREEPAQYQWTYRRFRRQASGRARREQRQAD